MLQTGRGEAFAVGLRGDVKLGGCILQVTTIARTAATFLLPLARSLRRLGWETQFAAAPDGAEEEITKSGFSFHPVSMARSPLAVCNLTALSRLGALIRAVDPDIVHVHTPVAGLLGRLASLSAKPVVYTLHGIPAIFRSERLGALLCRCEEMILHRYTEHYVAVSRGLKAALLSSGVPERKITVTGVGGSGVDFTRFSPRSDEEKVTLRARFGLKADDIVVGYVGRLVVEKGVRELVLSFRRLAQRFDNVRLLVVGDSVQGDRGALTKSELLQMLGPSASSAVFTGFLRDVSSAMACMDILCLPSYREGFPLVLAEAQAMGIPVVAAGNLGSREALIPGKTGLVVPARSVTALEAAIARLITDHELRRRMGMSGVRLAKERFGHEQVVRRHLEVYQSVLQARES